MLEIWNEKIMKNKYHKFNIPIAFVRNLWYSNSKKYEKNCNVKNIWICNILYSLNYKRPKSKYTKQLSELYNVNTIQYIIRC